MAVCSSEHLTFDARRSLPRMCHARQREGTMVFAGRGRFADSRLVEQQSVLVQARLDLLMKPELEGDCW